jgi:ATP-dependent helicase/nuclease subunit A
VEWVLDLPPKLFHEQDDVLAAHVAEAEADAAYEKLCLFYVATTRAKRAMYLITKPVKETSTSANFPRLLTETLGTGGSMDRVQVGEWACDAAFTEGDAKWFEAISCVAETVAAIDEVQGIAAVAQVTAVVRHPASTPSGTKEGVVTGAALFGAASAGAASFGTAIHKAFAAVEWGGASSAVLATWKAAGLSDSVVAEARACMESSGLAGVFAREPGAEVWRERMFEIVLDGAWITGVFDRAVLTHDAGGRVIAATVYDFKTDRVMPGGEAGVAARYAGQMAVYRRAAARLTGLSEARVKCVLVLTALRNIVQMADTGAD